MKVAVLAPVAWRTPPMHYGPWEQVASNITEGLVAQGIDVTLFATGNSITKGKLEWVIEQGYEEERGQDAKVVECLHISHLMEMAENFDIIHNNFDFLPLTYSRLIKTPVITTIHGFSSEKIIQVYEKYNQSSNYVSISNSDRSPKLKYLATVYNGLKTDEFSFTKTPDDYLLYFGRIHRDKGTAEAIEIAKKAKKKLIIAG
ncbi:MAG: glycosyltransferase, partial [Mucilaginibacter sp.]